MTRAEGGGLRVESLGLSVEGSRVEGRGFGVKGLTIWERFCRRKMPQS